MPVTTEIARVRRKYRPSVRLVLLALNLAVLALPLAGLLFLRIYENQLVRETESELIAQAAVVGAVLKRAITAHVPEASSHGHAVVHTPGAGIDDTFAPLLPTIDLARDELLPPRPDGKPSDSAPSAAMLAIGNEVSETFQAAQMVTLAGLRVLNHDGVVIGGRGDIGMSFADLPEIRRAMSGRYAGVIRKRQLQTPRPAITSISRGAQARVFIAFPVVIDHRLQAIVYMSRTPDNVWRRMYQARYRLALAALVLLAIAAGLAIVASRTILGPVDALIRQSDLLAAGRITSVEPLRHAGTRELARLADSFADMANTLHRRSGFIRQFAVHVSHEFKTPLTAIQGASELLVEHFDTMSQDQRQTFLRNITDDADRLRRLVERLNQLAKAESALQPDTPLDVVAALQRLAAHEADASLALHVSGPSCAFVRVPEDGLDIILANLRSNAAHAGATRLDIVVAQDEHEVRIAVADNGAGISARDRQLIFEPSFTTRREHGGTGMGLRIIRSLIEPLGGSIGLGDSQADRGATFVIVLPRASPPHAPLLPAPG